MRSLAGLRNRHMTGNTRTMTKADGTRGRAGKSDSGLFFSLINGRVCACWHDTDHRVELASLEEADEAMRHFQLQTKVGERLSAADGKS